MARHIHVFSMEGGKVELGQDLLLQVPEGTFTEKTLVSCEYHLTLIGHDFETVKSYIVLLCQTKQNLSSMPILWGYCNLCLDLVCLPSFYCHFVGVLVSLFQTCDDCVYEVSSNFVVPLMPLFWTWDDSTPWCKSNFIEPLVPLFWDF